MLLFPVVVGEEIVLPSCSMFVPVMTCWYPVSYDILFIVSVTVLVVSVLLVIEPCVKFGTTGTAIVAGASMTLAHTTLRAEKI